MTVVGDDEEKAVDVLEPIVEEDKVCATQNLSTLVFIIHGQDLRLKAAAFMGVAKDATRSPEDVISTPLPGETLAMFYARSRKLNTCRPVSERNVRRR